MQPVAIFNRYPGPTICAIAMCLSLGAAATSLSAAPTAVEILQYERARMKKLKTYQASYITTSSEGLRSKDTIAIDLENVKARITSTRDFGSEAGKSRLLMFVVDDGKFQYVYEAFGNYWRKWPHDPHLVEEFTDSTAPSKDLERRFGITYKLLPSIKLAAKPVYVVQIQLKNMGGKHNENGEKILHYIDQATFRRRQTITITSKTGRQGLPVHRTSKMVVTDEKFDEPIPDGTFNFTPPPGSKEMKDLSGLGGPSPIPSR